MTAVVTVSVVWASVVAVVVIRIVPVVVTMVTVIVPSFLLAFYCFNLALYRVTVVELFLALYFE